MLRLIAFLLITVAVGTGLAWLADNPGNITISWQGTLIDVSVFTATWVSVLAIFLLFVSWSIFKAIWRSPAAVGHYFKRRRQARGLDALSSGMIAIGSGDRDSATRYAIQARKDLPNEPLTHLLRAQAAQLTDDRATSRRIYEGMLGSRDTEALGLRGLFLEAQKENETEAARQFAQRALGLNSKLGWASNALFDMQCKAKDWPAALETLASARKNGLVAKPAADRRRAVLLTAQAQIAEDDDPDKALKLALEAHGLAPKLVPAGDIAGRLLASRGNTAKAAKVLQNTWKRSPHPDLSLTYAYARPGDSPRDRLTRVKALARLTPHTIESPIAIATAAIEAHDWDGARKALAPLLDKRITQRVCTLMAQIEAEQHGDAGRVREWLARAVNAPRDPTWTADGVTSAQWAPVSPVSGELDAFEWRVPVESVDHSDAAVLTQRLEEFVALGAMSEPVIEAPAKVINEVEAVPAQASPAQPAPTQSPPVQSAPTRSAPSQSGVQTGTAAEAVTTAADPIAAAVGGAATGVPVQPAATANHAAQKAAAPPAQATPVHEPMNVASPAAAPAAAEKEPAAAEAAVAESARSVTNTKSNAEPAEPDSIDVEPVLVAPPAQSAAKGKASSPATASGKQKAAAKKKAATAKASGSRRPPPNKKPTETKIFVPPRAPDDPGTESSDLESAQRSSLSSFRSGQIKGSA